MSNIISRRDFLKLSALAAAGVAIPHPFTVDREDIYEANYWGRVANTQVSIYSRPEDTSRILKQKYRDEIFRVYKAVLPPTGPSWNPVWYRVWGGYIHSANIQLVSTYHNKIADPNSITGTGKLATVTVPYVQTMRYTKYDGWTNLYRLYFQTNHWITGLRDGPDGVPWYQITDELGNTIYYAPAHQFRIYTDEELAPISSHLEWQDKRIEVDLSRQTLTAYEKDEIVLYTKVSTGIYTATASNGIPTQTPKGDFNIQNKMPSKHMGQGRLTDNLEDYELVGVPWTSFFDPRGYAFHGTFWHNNFGVAMSRGCVNMTTHDSQWLFRWITPYNESDAISTTGLGTQIKIF